MDNLLNGGGKNLPPSFMDRGDTKTSFQEYSVKKSRKDITKLELKGLIKNPQNKDYSIGSVLVLVSPRVTFRLLLTC